MSLFGKLKDKFIGRKEAERDFGTVRSAILGEYPPAHAKDSIQPAWKTKYSESIVPKDFAQPSLDMEKEELDIRQPYAQSFGQTPEAKESPRFEKRDFYDISDRLSVIEAQLTAIRSQTETINERLKMLEMRLQRRY